GFGDLILGAGGGGGPQVIVVSGQTAITSGIDAAMASPVISFFAGNANSRAGVQVAADELNGDANADVITGGFVGSGGTLTAYSGAGLTAGTLMPLFNLTAALGDGVLLPGIASPPVVPPVPPPPPDASGALVTLNLNPLDINLLGLQIQTSPITVTVSAEAGSGELLGNALTLASHLVNLPGVSDALNNVL